MEKKDEDYSKVDMAEVKKVLRDANIYEMNMSKELMVSYYTALTNSKTTAPEEDQLRKLNQSEDEVNTLLDDDVGTVGSSPVQIKGKSFVPKFWTSEMKSTSQEILEHNNNENLVEDDILEDLINDSPQDATKTIFGFNEMLRDSENTFKIITHELKSIPIQNSTTFLNARVALKARMLYAYHTKVNKMKTDLARLSFYPAALPKAICPTEMISIFQDMDDLETYVSRSGRQTKRKIYNYDDDEDSLDNANNKKLKNSEEPEWFEKSTPIKSTVRLHKKQEIGKSNMEGNKTEPESVETHTDKKNYARRETRTPLSKKISNMEIMNRSSLFTDSPKSICEINFEELKKDEEKKAKEEKTMELFNKTFTKSDEECNDMAPNEDVITVDDEELVRIRVVPSIPGRKVGNRKRNNIKVNTLTEKNIVTEQNGSSAKEQEEFISKSHLRKRPIRKTPSNLIDPLPSTSQISEASTTNNILCPICNRSFEEDKIEEHAATCGDEPVTRSNSKVSRITCEICDKVVPLDFNYEFHVQNCIARKNDKD